MDDALPERARRHHELQRSMGGAPMVTGSHVSDRLVASWQRSEGYGVSLESIEPSFTGTFDDESLFFECGREVLAGLHQTLINEPVSLMLTDADGLVLNRMSGDTSLLRALDAVHLAPGPEDLEEAAELVGAGDQVG